MLVLLVEDNPLDAKIIARHLKSALGNDCEVAHADRLSAGLERLAEGDIDAVLLDLELPDSSGPQTLSDFRASAGDVPVVVMTGHDDEILGQKLIQQGAQDFLVKGQFDGSLFGRTIRYAIERQRLLRELDATRHREQHERELRMLNRAARDGDTPTTASLFGQTSLRESGSGVFDELVKQYENLIDRAVEQRKSKVEYDLHGDVRSMAERLEFLRSTPRDLVEVHGAALERISTEAPSMKNQVLREEAKYLLLELMGRLCSLYRKYATGISTGRSPISAPSSGLEDSAESNKS
jgi:DNA-binding NarL/FixJ family response regulator